MQRQTERVRARAIEREQVIPGPRVKNRALCNDYE